MRRNEMNLRSKAFLLLAVFAVLALSGLQGFASDYGAKGALSDSEVDLEAMLTYAIQDEYLARAEYELIMKKHGEIRPFSNIIRSEEQHIGMLVDLFDDHGYGLPEDTAGDHVVVPESLKKALETGVQAEIDNIAMYESFLERELPADVRDVFEKLKRASENHLRAFRNNLNRYR
jgi:hypothetical protein